MGYTGLGEPGETWDAVSSRRQPVPSGWRIATHHCFASVPTFDVDVGSESALAGKSGQLGVEKSAVDDRCGLWEGAWPGRPGGLSDMWIRRNSLRVAKAGRANKNLGMHFRTCGSDGNGLGENELLNFSPRTGLQVPSREVPLSGAVARPTSWICLLHGRYRNTYLAVPGYTWKEMISSY